MEMQNQRCFRHSQPFGFVSGHDFSRAVRQPKQSWALAPALFLANTSLGHSHPVPKYELSPRPERSVVEGPAVDSSTIKYKWKRLPPLCHPERTRISGRAALDMAACAPFRKERRMKLA